ncbi:MAG: hypothetical protein LBL01_04740, partial [Bifidobacteriaceae bacterium]|nr:hypothetical protein [Bifidobacteriaceae bacterium]
MDRSRRSPRVWAAAMLVGALAITLSATTARPADAWRTFRAAAFPWNPDRGDWWGHDLDVLPSSDRSFAYGYAESGAAPVGWALSDSARRLWGEQELCDRPFALGTGGGLAVLRAERCDDGGEPYLLEFLDPGDIETQAVQREGTPGAGVDRVAWAVGGPRPAGSGQAVARAQGLGA